MGNHEHLALDSWKQGKDPGFTRAYRYGTWEANGGGTQEFTETQKTWIDNLPSVIFKKSTTRGVRDLVLTHAPLCESLESALNSAALTGGPKHHFLLQFLWNRWGPVKVRNLFQVFGHDVRGLKPTLENSYCSLDTGAVYGIYAKRDPETAANRKLHCLLYPSKQLLSVDFCDKIL